MSTVPSWLVGYVGQPARRVPRPRKPRAEIEVPTAVGRDLIEPNEWAFDGDLTRREPVLDPNWNRVVRYVGWRKCLRCSTPHFTPDVVKVRICGACKLTQVERDQHASKPGPKPSAEHPYRNFNFKNQS
jgi:hypothetical protein